MSFASDMAKFAENAGNSIENTMQAIGFQLFDAIIKDTPVDEGRARGNWQASINAPILKDTDKKDKTGNKTSTEMYSVSKKFKAGTVFYITNNLPYIWSLEYGGYGRGDGATNKTTRDGYSIQAPYGMVRKNVARIQSIVAAEARKNRV